MKTFTLTHEIHCDTETFWKTFFDKAFNDDLFKNGLGFPAYETVELRDSDNEIFRRVKATPKIDAPGPVVKALGSSFSFTEDGTFDKTTKVFSWKSTPSSMADKMKTEGTVRVEATGEGKVRRVCEFHYEAKVFGISGLLESSLEKSLRSGWDKSADFMNRHLKGKSA